MYTPSSSSSSSPLYATTSSDRHAVHFPPSPTLTRTYVAHSSVAYDRSPIIVAPNTCALPERGCPGRTYTLDDERSLRSSPPKRRSHSGMHLHPCAVSNHPVSNIVPRNRGVEDDIARIPTRSSSLLPPPLVPDLSSESDESDGFTSPTPVPCNPSLTPAPSISRLRARGDAMIYTGSTCFEEHDYPNIAPDASFLPHPPSSDDAHKARRRRQCDRSRERERSKASKYTCYPSDEPCSEGGYKSFSPYAGCGSDDGCLGGF
ncbi:hypothetical protein F5I97DRAFT_1913282 [Phlebopus sp. FC_14]|nr:hypothetical protein F5I97DRAFT_1913282 [Phlebopus sp. FC_14]